MQRTAAVVFCGFVLGAIPVLAETVNYDTSLVSPDTNPVTNGVNSTNLSWYNGSGNTGVQGGWTVADGGGIELGLGAILRQVNNVIDSPNGIYYVPPGIETNPPAQATNPARDAWNYQFSIDLNPGGAEVTPLTFSQVTASLQVTDLNTSTSFTIDPTLIPDDSAFGTANGTTLANRHSGVVGSTDWGAQNSQNPLFGGFAPLGIYGQSMPYDMNAPDTYRVDLTVSQGSNVLASDEIFIEVTPEPSTWVLFVGGAAAIWFLRKRAAKVIRERA